jgi:hypothetical protein
MPNRILRPWLDSEAVNSLSAEGEVFFVRLIMCVDDFGRFYGSPQLLKSYLYPLKNMRVSDISRLIAACVKAGVIADYEHDGKRYLQIIKFKQRLRKQKSIFPAPPRDILEKCKLEEQSNDESTSTGRQLSANRPTIDRQLTDKRPTIVRQSTDTCPPEEEVEEETENKMDSDKSSSITPEPGRPGGPGRRNAAERLFFDYDGDRKIHGITPELLAYWREMYPALDVESELKKASTWLDGNRRNRKTDLKRFLVNWLNKAQDRAPRRLPEEDTQTEHQGWDI